MHSAHHHTIARSESIGRRLGWLAVAAAAVATTALGAGVARGETGRSGPAITSTSVPPTATIVIPDDGAVALAYIDCLRSVSRTADTQERWADACRDLAVSAATVAAFERQCRDSASAGADVIENRSGVCHERAVQSTAAQAAFLACVRDAPTADAAERSGCAN